MSDSKDTRDLKPSEVGDIMSLSTVTIRRMINDGQFPGAYRISSRAWRVPPSALEDFRRRNAVRGASS